MKKLALIAMLFCTITVFAQRIPITETRLLPNNDNDSLQRVANEFANKVGAALKSNYPADIDIDEGITVSITKENGQIRLTYSASIERTDTESALYYFDHRGALSVSWSASEAQADAQKKMRATIQCFAGKV